MPKILRYPTVAAGAADWSNPNNIKVEDGLYATSSNWTVKGSSGDITASAFNFNIPSTAIIDGIVVEAKYGGNRLGGLNSIGIGNTGTAKTAVKTDSNGNSAQLFYSTGGEADLWGRTDWTPADFDNNFYARYSFMATSSPADAVCNVDVIRVTIYWHTAPADVETREVYKVFSPNGSFLGVLPQPNEKLKLAQDINSLGSQITVTVPITPDTSDQTTEAYTTEDLSAIYTAEDGSSPYTANAALPIMSSLAQGIDTLIKNGNIVQIWHFNYWYPNGKCMFVGIVRRWEADFGNDNDAVTMALYSTGYDTDNYFTRGAPFSYATDQVQTATDNFVTVVNNTGGSSGVGWNLYGQTFTIGAGVSNVAGINLLLAGSATVIVRLFDQPNGNLLGETSLGVNVINPSSIIFGFPALAGATPGAQYFFTVDVAGGSTINLYYQSSNVYAGGSMYNSSYGGGSGGGGWNPQTGDLYFVSLSGTNSTTATYTNKDPSTGMLAPIISDYNLRGGMINWKASSIDATGLSLTYTFKVQTVKEALDAILSLAPNGFYYYVDLGTQTIYFKNQSATADFVLQKGVHVGSLKLITSTEQTKNTIIVTGGETSPGVNLYRQYSSAPSIAALGPLLDRKSDNRVTLDATADAIGLSELSEKAREQFQTTVSVPHSTKIDITLLRPGKTVALRGYGTFVDTLITQIVHWEWMAEEVVLTLGTLPVRQILDQERLTREMIAQQTQDNPSTPS